MLLTGGCEDVRKGILHPGRPGEILPITMVRDLNPADWPQDPVDIRDAVVDGDLLTLRVLYAGGCKEHTFQLVASEQFLESYPVQVHTLLAHDARDDACEASIFRDLRFDLTPLKKSYQQAYRSTTGVAIVRLGDLRIRYEF